MRRDQVEELVAAIAQDVCAAAGLFFVDANYRKSNGAWRILVRIDRPEGVSINDCAEVSKTLGAKLDELDPIEHEYTLEVSSVGLSEPLKTEADLRRYIGRRIELELQEGRRARSGPGATLLVGTLLSFTPEMLLIATEDGERQVVRGTIRRVRPAVDFKSAGARVE